MHDASFQAPEPAVRPVHNFSATGHGGPVIDKLQATIPPVFAVPGYENCSRGRLGDREEQGPDAGDERGRDDALGAGASVGGCLSVEAHSRYTVAVAGTAPAGGEAN